MEIFNKIKPERLGLTSSIIAKSFRDGLATTRGNVERIHKNDKLTFLIAEEEELGSEESLLWYIHNPPVNDRVLYMYYGEVTHSDTIDVVLHTDVENVTSDVSEPPSNNFIGSDVSSNAEPSLIASSSDFDSLDTHFTQRYFGESTEMFFDGYRITVPPGEDIVIDIQNQGGNNFIGTRISWSEELV